MAQGKVKWFNAKKGFGFIFPDDGGKDLFVHITNVQSDSNEPLQDGQAVEFEVAEGKKGPEAVNVRPMEQEF